MNSRYILMTTEKSFCPKCEKPVHLLTSRGPASEPSFYICFNGCKFVGEVGEGPVEAEENANAAG